MIKKKIKKHYLVYNLERKWEDSGLLDGLTGLILDTNIFPVGTVDSLLINQYPNNWQVTLAGQERLVLDADGDMRITGRLHSIGTVIWNQELNRLEFWDGNQWTPINTTIIH